MHMLRPEADDTLTLADIARHFALPESTARYYCKRFAPFLPSTGEGRRKRYRSGALEVMQSILNAMEQSRTASAVEQELAQRFPRTVELAPVPAAVADAPLPAAAPTPATTPAPAANTPELTPPTASPAFFPAAALQLLEQQTQAIQRMATVLESIQLREQRLEDLEAQFRQRDEDNAELRRQLAAMRVLLETSERTQQADSDQLRNWISRVIRHHRQ